MGKSYVKVSILMAIMVLLLTGCGVSLPDMTQEEEQMVSEYAAKILMKYDANKRSRLVSREKVEEREAKLQQKEEAEIQKPTQEGMEPVDDTPVIEIGQEISGSTTRSLEEFFGLPDGLKIVYQGNETFNSYPQDDSMNSYFSLDAAEGKDLLVLKFYIENQSQTDHNVDLLSQSATARVTINGGHSQNVLTTMLMNDLATYIGDISANEKVDVVLLVEVDEDMNDEMSSLSLNVKNDSKTCTIQLR